MANPQHTPTDQPAMPDPRRTVRRAVTHLIRTGLTPQEAAQMIVNVTIAVEAQLHAIGITDITWVHDLWIAACVIEAGTKPESGREDDTDQQGSAARAVRWSNAVIAGSYGPTGAGADEG